MSPGFNGLFNGLSLVVTAPSHPYKYSGKHAVQDTNKNITKIIVKERKLCRNKKPHKTLQKQNRENNKEGETGTLEIRCPPQVVHILRSDPGQSNPSTKGSTPRSAQIEGAYIQEAPKLKVQSAGKKG